MADCKMLEKCIFFNDKMQNMPAVADIYKQNYCRGDFSKCARFMVAEALGKEKVPSTLFPNQVELASEIIRKG
ncbi:MAG: hypothetical protein M0Z38_05320 [Deltaproteobacteria bacterium]|nr:hypothetical protein [Deltaproteobacteria bacterium]